MTEVADLDRLWAGNLYGTNTGRLFLEILPADDGAHKRLGTLRVSDTSFGVSTYTLSVYIENGRVFLVGDPQTGGVEGLNQGSITAEAVFRPDGSLSGEWSSTIGTAGTFILHPHVGLDQQERGRIVEQIYTSSRDLGALRLYKSDLDEIITTLRRKFPESRIVVSHIDRGAELSLYADEFESRSHLLERLDWIKLAVQAPAGSGFNKSLTIDLGLNFNRVTTQGPDESWVLGEVEATVSSLRRSNEDYLLRSASIKSMLIK